jgi:hypothetical protein
LVDWAKAGAPATLVSIRTPDAIKSFFAIILGCLPAALFLLRSVVEGWPGLRLGSR